MVVLAPDPHKLKNQIKGGFILVSEKSIFKTLVELKLQLHYDEINGQTFVDTCLYLRELFLKVHSPEEWERLYLFSEEEFLFVRDRLKDQKSG
jgi:hypothetical protein